jgi:hypothetical protein
MMMLRPLSGGVRGWPFGRTVRDLDRHGYLEEEYLLEGEASRYAPAPGTELGHNGRWDVVTVETSPFRTRLLVMHPRDPAAFNGTVLVSWNNVSAGHDITFLIDSLELLEGGYAYVAVTAQRAGVHGRRPVPMGLVSWDPERYGTLSIPSDDYSFDIFTQAVRALGPERPRATVDPLGGLEVQRVIAHGSSQSAGRLATYVNAIHPLALVVDGFLISLYFGAGVPLEVGDYVLNTADAGARPFLEPHLLRDDIGTPIMVLNSETESAACLNVAQSDTDSYRYWEVAGAAHFDRHMATHLAPKLTRDLGPPPPPSPGTNAIPTDPVLDAALHHMNQWLRDGLPPPVQPRIAYKGDPPTIERDEHGIARGGIRLPQADVPLARNSSEGEAGPLGISLEGSWEPFSFHKIVAQYGDREKYLVRFEAAAKESVKAGVVLERDVEPLLVLAGEEWSAVSSTR